MLQELYRIIFIILILGIIVFVFIVKRRKIIKIKKIIIGLFLLLVIIFTAIFPPDNYIFNFSSPIEVAKYAEVGKMITSIENGDIGVVFFEKTDVSKSISKVMSRKVNGKWKLCSSVANYFYTSILVGDGYLVSTYSSNTSKNIIVSIENYNYYEAFSLGVDISDNHNSTFSTAKIPEGLARSTEIYYTILDSADENYELSINGNTSKIFG